MKHRLSCSWPRGRSVGLIALLLCCLAASLPLGAITLHVSKRGDGSDGHSWNTAFRSIQKALDLEDCTLAGATLFTPGDAAKAFTWTTRGRNQAYVQFKQAVPAGFERLGAWPTELFARLAPPTARAEVITDTVRPKLVRLPFAVPRAMENSPVIFQGRPLHILNYRDDTKNNTDGYKDSMYLYAVDLATGDTVARFGEGHSFASAFVNGEELSVFGSEGSNREWFQSIYRFSTRDLKVWKRELAIPRVGNEHLFNVSVCRDDQGFVMAYESNLPVQFCFRFARSRDLSTWEPVPDLTFTGVDREYSACPVLRYFAPYYYVIYLHAPVQGRKELTSFLARSRDLADWELTPFNPILTPGPGEGINNSDVDLFEWEDRTYLTYATGDQATWGAIRVALYDGPMREFFERHFPAGLPTVRLSARTR